MKNLLRFVLLLSVVFFVLPLGAQSFEFDLDNQSVGFDLNYRNRVRIGLKGIEVNYGRDHYVGHPMVWGFGFTTLPSPDYSMYDEHDRDFFALDVARSQRWFINPFHASVAFNEEGTFGLVSSLGIAWNNFVFDQNITVAQEDALLMPIPLDKKYKKSKLTTVAFSVPVELEVQFPRKNEEDKRFFMAGGLLGEVVVGSHTKFKKPKHKQKGNLGVNPFQAAITARIGYDDVSIFCNYNLTTLFEKNKGPEMQALTFGIGLNL